MAPTAVNFFTYGQDHSDCAIATLAMYLGYSYVDVLRVAALKEKQYQAKHGMMVDEIIATAKLLGTTLSFSRTVDLEDDYGILVLPEHVNLLRNGLIIDPDGTIWEVDDYLQFYELKDQIEGILKGR